MLEEKIECIIFVNNFNIESYNEIEILDCLPFVSAYRVLISKTLLSRLIKLKKVVHYIENTKVTSCIKEAKNFIHADAFYNKGLYGKGIGVAVIDTGVAPILDLCVPVKRIVKFVDFTDKSLTSPYDDNGHGTFVSGIIAGNGLMSVGEYSGVAPMSNIVSLKALNDKGEANSFTILKAMQWIIDNRKKYNIKVVCMSFGSEPHGKCDSLCYGANKLWQNGLVVVAAGGNNGPKEDTITSPGVSNKIITVGALDKLTPYLKVADFSSRGNPKSYNVKPDILAPGTKIISTNRDIKNGGPYTTMSGTSVATPIIAGVCALLCEKFPNYRPDQIKSIILHHGVDVGDNRQSQGRGAFVY